MDKSERLIHLFNQLDEYLRIKHFNNNPSYTSYSRKIYYIKKHHLEPVFENKRDFDVIKKAGEIRNIVVHNNDLVDPNETFLNQFEALVERITRPKRVDQVMTPYQRLKKAQITDRLNDAIQLIKKHGFASIPVLKDGHVLGFFTEKTVFDYLTISDRIVDKDMTLETLKDVINFDQKPRAYFKFISRDMTVDEAYQIFIEDFRKKHELMLLLVTEHGDASESLLGIVALRDLKNVIYEQ